MAKLTNVKTIDMVNGEVTKVSYEGAEYALTSEPVKEGDLFQLREGHYVEGGEVDAFYPTYTHSLGEIAIPTKYAGSATYTQSKGWGAAFRKINVQTPTIEERVTELETEVAALKGEKANETIEFEGAEYRKVDREAREGDVVIFKDGIYSVSWITEGKSYKAFGDNIGVYVTGDDGDGICVYESDYRNRTIETVDVYEPIEQAKYVPQKGDYITVTGNRQIGVCRPHFAKVGEVLKVQYRTGGNDRVITDKGAIMDELYRKATPAEVEQYEKAVAEASKPKLKAGDFVKFKESRFGITAGKVYEVVTYEDGDLVVVDDEGLHDSGINSGKEYEIVDAETAKWAKIGRVVGEAKVGDIVRVVVDVSGKPVGTIFEVKRASGSSVRCDFGYTYTLNANVELVAPVESLFTTQN